MNKYTCVECGNEFERESGRGGGNVSESRRKFCSKLCNGRFWGRKRWEERDRKPNDPKPCLTCGGIFVAGKSHPKQVCCSSACRAKLNNQLDAEKRDSKRPTSAICLSDFCKKEFQPSRYSWGTQKFCSGKCYRRECQRRWRTKHPQMDKFAVRRRKWRGNWWKALERDAFTCQLCGLKGSSEDTSKLLVHHLDGEGERQGKNHVLENLQTLCGSCHAKIHHSLLLVRKEGKLFVKFGDKYLPVVE